MKKLLCGIIPLVLVLVLCTGCGSVDICRSHLRRDDSVQRGENEEAQRRQ